MQCVWQTHTEQGKISVSCVIILGLNLFALNIWYSSSFLQTDCFPFDSHILHMDHRRLSY